MKKKKKFTHLKMNGLNIKEFREKLGLTQLELAEMIGVSRNTIINYEKGGVIPEAKRKILHKVLGENAQEATLLEEPEAIYNTYYDEKIAKQKEEIEKIKKEIEKWEAKLKENPDKGDTYKKYIASYEEQIYLHNQIINITLEAKMDYLENRDE